MSLRGRRWDRVPDVGHMTDKLDDAPMKQTTSEVPTVRTKKVTSEFVAARDSAQLVVLAGSGTGRRYPVQDEVTIGRHPACAVWIPDEGVSRQHAAVGKTPAGSFVIKDLGSRNRTFVNGVPVQEHELTFGDKISIGAGVMLVFSYADPMEQHLLQLQKIEAVGRMAAGVAHEFNNLLAAVLNNLSLVLDGHVSGDEAKDCLAEARLAALRGKGLSGQMLDFSRASESDRERVDLSELVEEVIQLIRRTFARSITIETEVEPDLTVVGDRLQLYQVLMNLCINARDALGRRGQLQIRARRRDAEVEPLTRSGLTSGVYAEITVTDNGRGISAEDLPRVFDPFFTTKKAGEGTGLGLSMAQGLLRQHRGVIEITSEPQQGTSVIVCLPCTEPEAAPALTVEKPTVSAPVAPDTVVLVVEDDELVCNSLRRILQSQGFVVETAPDGETAVRTFEQQKDRIDLVILDMVMPGLSGKETFSLLKRLDPRVKVVISSGFVEDDVPQELLRSGAVGYLKKPFDPETLREMIDRVLRDGGR